MAKAEWFNDDGFWGQFAPIIFDDRRWKEVPMVADGITALARISLYPLVEGETIVQTTPRCLDLCCGFGRIALELARRGFLVTGVDITESYLEAGRDDAREEELDVLFIKRDVREFCERGAYDIALNCYISFGYFEDSADDLCLVKNAYDSLKDGGDFFMETLGKEIAARDFTRGEWFQRAGCYVLTSYHIVDSWGALQNTWRLFDKNGQIAEKTFVQRLYSAVELRALVLQAGFKSVEIYGDWDQSPYDENAEKLIAVGRK
ncbi:MAG: class I SAM-dependent methyltransferase [Treponema sp.]|jgi:SAM-dependent methyltransferase|nr:class I SAM-dependent methyltransferase [Treponema sp.]